MATPAHNATKWGLFSAPGNFVRPDEQATWDQINKDFWRDLSPVGPVEATLTVEIVRAAWRLRRCAAVEAALADRQVPGLTEAADPMEDPANNSTQNSVDRARIHSQRVLHRTLADLQRLQIERQLRNEEFPRGSDRTRSAAEKEIPQNDLPKLRFAERTSPVTQPSPQTGRNTPCPCGSGLKYKRCCGQGAPALFMSAA